jgi:butyryl-CoA dehydrogenase
VAWSSEHQLFRKTVRDFCESRLRPLVAEAEEAECFPRDSILQPMAELGFFRVGVPEEAGGAGGDSLMRCIVAEEVARICGGFAASITPCVVGPSLLMKLATPAQRQALLEPLMSGGTLACIALTEPGAGSDLLSLKTTARRDGDAYVLNGSKTFVTNGPIADLVFVAAVLAEYAGRTGIGRAVGINLFAVPRQVPGFHTARKLGKLGMRSSETGELVFDECRIPVENRMGGEGGSMIRVLRTLDSTRLYIAALSLGLAQAAFEASRAYAKERVTFGKSIGNHQAIAFKIARMALDIEAARLLIHRAAELHDSGTRATREISMAKLFATEAAVRITGDAIQIHGGYGYTTEFPLERYFRDAKVGTIWEGTSEMQQLIIAQELGLLRQQG